MSRVRLFLLSVVAIVAVGAFASTSALATTPVYLVCLEKTGSGTKFEERNCSKALGTGKFELVAVAENLGVTGTLGVSVLTSTLLKAEIKITCKKGKFTGTIGANGASKGEVTYEECEAGNSKEKFASCKVPNIKFKFIDQLVEKSATEVEDEFKPETGSIFVEIVIENKGTEKCLEKGTFPVEGTQNAETEKPSLGALLLRNLTFKTSGSKLKFNKTETATYEGKASIDLNNDDSWGVSIP
jgi:hypothetical protein